MDGGVAPTVKRLAQSARQTLTVRTSPQAGATPRMMAVMAVSVRLKKGVAVAGRLMVGRADPDHRFKAGGANSGKKDIQGRAGLMGLFAPPGSG
jgi:hypothetical protein